MSAFLVGAPPENCSQCNGHAATVCITDAFDLLDHDSIGHHLCKRCGLSFDSNVNEMLKVNIDLAEIQEISDDRLFRDIFVETSHIAEPDGTIYSDFEWTENDAVKRGVTAHIFDPIRKYASKETGLKILDVGCGNGFTAVEMSKAFADSRIVAMDPSSDVLGVKNASGVTALQGTLQSRKLESDTFNAGVIVGNFMLHYNPVETLQEMHRVLQPDGLLVIDFKNVRSTVRWGIGLMAKFGLVKLLPQYFVQRSFVNMRYGFDRRYFERICSEAGFEILENYSKPPRLLEFENRHNLSSGIKGVIWRITDMIDKIFDQRAWIQYVLRAKK